MTTPPNAVIVGIGELGGVFARGLLKLGHSVVPVTRQQSISGTLEATSAIEVILISVGESELDNVLSQIPTGLKDKVALVQNELVPSDWEGHGYRDPSGIVVWFEKKAGRDVHVVLPSLAYGPQGELLRRSLQVLGIPCEMLGPEQLPTACAQKNLYILVHNIAGLVHPGSVSALWHDHPDFAHTLAEEIIAHQEARLGRVLDRAQLFAHLQRAVAADPEHGSAGRSAPSRLARALKQAVELGLNLPTLERVAAEQ